MRWPIAAASCLLAACPGGRRAAPPLEPVQPQAIIGTSGARFVFPLDTMGAIRAGAVEQRLGWSVYWWDRRTGMEPHAIWVKRRAAPDSLSAPFEAMVMTAINDAEPPQSSGVVDAEVVARVQEARLVVEVRGRAAVKRTFPVVPDSVLLSWSANEGMRGAKVAVELREPWR